MHKILFCKCTEGWAKYAPLVLRLSAGTIFAMHGYQKFSGGIDGVAGFFTQLGIFAPTFFAYVVTYVELLGGIALILGIFTHWAAKLLAIDMLVATWIVHIPNGFFITNGGISYTLILFAVAISLMLSGPGIWSLDEQLTKKESKI